MSGELLEEGWTKLANLEFVSQENEAYWVDDEEDTGEDRTKWHFGPVCPLKGTCKSYAEKKHKCSSLVCDDFARSYLCKHAFDSSNHPETQGKMTEAKEAANEAQIHESVETKADRTWYRDNVRRVQAWAQQQKAANGARKPRSPACRRSPARRAERSHDGNPRDNKREGKRRSRSRDRKRRSSKRSKSKSRGTSRRSISKSFAASSDGEAPVAIGARPSRSSARLGAKQPSHPPPGRATAKVEARPVAQLGAEHTSSSTLATMREENVIKVTVKDLQMLAKCLDRVCDSQKKMCESMRFFSRQFEDEAKIMDEAKKAIDRVVATSVFLVGGNPL